MYDTQKKNILNYVFKFISKLNTIFTAGNFYLIHRLSRFQSTSDSQNTNNLC